MAAIRNTIYKINTVIETTLKRLNFGLLSRTSAQRWMTVPGKTVQGHTTDWHHLCTVVLLPYGLFQRKKSRCTFSCFFVVVSSEHKWLTSLRKQKVKLEGRQPFLAGRWNKPYVSPFNTARQFCSNCRLPFACFSSNSASSTKFFLNAATLLVLKSISSCFADSDIFSNF